MTTITQEQFEAALKTEYADVFPPTASGYERCRSSLKRAFAAAGITIAEPPEPPAAMVKLAREIAGSGLKIAGLEIAYCMDAAGIVALRNHTPALLAELEDE